MAIKFDIQSTQYGIPVQGAYARIVNAPVMRQNGTAHKHMVTLIVFAYATDAPTEETREVATYRHSVPLIDIDAQTGDTFLARCYAWLMQQDDFVGGVEA